jgi:uncharacterized membrane protein
VPAIAIGLAALSALVWGSSDYCGGRASRRADSWAVTLLSQIVGAATLVVWMFFVSGRLYGTDLVWGAAAGMTGVVGMVLFYRGLATGAASIVAPVAAVTSALVPMVAGLIMERAPGGLAVSGAVCAVVAIALVSISPAAPLAGAERPPSPGVGLVGLALTSGALFGVFFVLLAQTHDDSGMWPLVGARLGSIPLGLVLMAAQRLPLRVSARTVPWVLGAGVGDIAANALYLVASRDGAVSVIAPIAALYPVSTVLLALAIDRERVRTTQVVGLGLAAAALVLTAV